MKFIETQFEGLYVVELEKFGDQRGFFARIFDSKEFESKKLKGSIAQVNTSLSVEKGTLRGMHFQKAPHAEAKYISCIKGAFYDVVIDLRPDSPTYKKWFGIELRADDSKYLYVPEGFAHGFITLEDNTQALYFVSQFYNPQSEGGVRFDDPTFNIKWPIPAKVISDKDKLWPDFKD